MRIRKARSAPEGAPDWVVTFGDMMSLLLCFLVLLWMISAATTEEEKARMIEGFQQGLLPSASEATNFDPDRTGGEARFLPGRENIPGSGAVLIDGNSVQRVQEQGVQIALAGPEAFDVGSWTLLPAAEVSLQTFADQHLHNRLGVRLTGFAEPGEAEGAQLSDDDELGYRRAKSVEAFLRAYTGSDGRWALEAERIHIATRGSRVVQGAIGPEMRRVELRLIETTSSLP